MRKNERERVVRKSKQEQIRKSMSEHESYRMSYSEGMCEQESKHVRACGEGEIA